MKVFLKNARVISPDLDLPGAGVLLAGEKIAGIYPPGDEVPPAEEVCDCGGRMLVPGFVDIHCHGAAGRDFCDATPEALAALCRAKLAEGVTTFLGTTLTVAEERLLQTARTARAHQAGSAAGAELAGLHLEGPFFNPAGAGAQNPEFLRPFDLDLVKRLHEICPVRIASYSIELPGAREFTRGLVEMGIKPSCGHSYAKYADFKPLWAIGLKHMTHFCNIMTPLHHLELGLVGGAFRHADVYVEIICDFVHLCPEMIELIYAVKGAERVMLITDSMRAAGMPDGEYDLGGQAVQVRDGCARLPSGVVAGSTLRFWQALRNVRAVTGRPLAELIKSAGWNQAQSLGLPGVGKIAPSFAADLVLLNDDFSPSLVWKNGRRHECSRLAPAL